MDLYEIVRKLVGPIEPVGETHADERRLVSLKQTTELVDKLLADISRVAACSERHEGSVRKAGQEAQEFLDNTRDWLTGEVE